MKRYLLTSSAVLALVFGWTTCAQAQAKPADLPAQNQIECPDGSDDPMPPPRFSIEIGLDLFSKRMTVKVGVAQPAAPMDIDAVCPAVISAYLEQLVKHLSESIAAAHKRIEQDTADTRSIEVRLFDPVKVRIEQVPLKQAIKNLAYASGLPIVIDYKSMRDARINLDSPVTLKGENVSAHKALRQFLDDLDLAYEIKDGLVRITPAEKCMRPLTDAERLAQAADRLAERLFEAGEQFRSEGEYRKARMCYQQVHRLTPTTLHGRVAIARMMEIEARMIEDAEEQGVPRNAEPEEAFQRMRNRTVPLGLVVVSY